MTTTTSKVDKYFASLPSTVMPLWTQMSKMVPPNPNPSTVPLLWKYGELRPRLMEAGEIVAAEDAERRVLMLVNPRLGPWRITFLLLSLCRFFRAYCVVFRLPRWFGALGPPHTTDTIYGGLQLVLPNEVAPAHRHTAFALRFIIEGTGGFTAVEGQKIIMAPGDVILTPSWHWHDHGNEGSDPVIWLDGLNLPIFTRLPVNFAELYQENRYPSELAACQKLSDDEHWLSGQISYLITMALPLEECWSTVPGRKRPTSSSPLSTSRKATIHYNWCASGDDRCWTSNFCIARDLLIHVSLLPRPWGDQHYDSARRTLCHPVESSRHIRNTRLVKN